jgi:hypothetical protein
VERERWVAKGKIKRKVEELREGDFQRGVGGKTASERECAPRERVCVWGNREMQSPERESI